MSDQAANQQRVPVHEVKGRPMLHWVGKRPLDYVTAFPAQQVERFDPADSGERGNLLFHGDNKDVLAWLLANGYRGKVKVIYIDPPFDSGADYIREVDLRGVADVAKLTAESYSLGEQVQYTDIWANDTYLQFMYERLLLLRELLSQDGAIYLHTDWHRTHHLRCVMDEIFGAENFRNEIIWAYPGREMHVTHKFNAKHDNILFYGNSDEAQVNMHAVALQYDRDERVKGLRRKVHVDENGREWVWETRGQAAGQEPYKRYLDEIIGPGRALNDVWDDIQFLRGNDPRRTGFPTQKPDALLERIIQAASNPGDLVLDCFVGSGTTAAVAQKLGRRWIAADINKGAIQTASKRLQTIVLEQIDAGQMPQQPTLLDEQEEQEGDLAPAALSFTHYRVNDYDLAIQHNEAVQLAAEHIGFQRAGDDPFFEGRLGQRLVRLVPFNHPITRLDLQQVAEELKTRDDTRDVVVVGLGKELAVDEWLEDYNRRRPINKIELIELRTDEKYGEFFQHEPARADVNICRQDGQIIVEVEDFISPTIVKRLEIDTPLFRTRIPDWRSMVDVILIDTGYDGEVFDITLSDVPERKDDLVQGRYEVPAPDGETTVAVKVIDMLGEEVLVTKEV